jgi:hypothetical protein
LMFGTAAQPSVSARHAVTSFSAARPHGENANFNLVMAERLSNCHAMHSFTTRRSNMLPGQKRRVRTAATAPTPEELG